MEEVTLNVRSVNNEEVNDGTKASTYVFAIPRSSHMYNGQSCDTSDEDGVESPN